MTYLIKNVPLIVLCLFLSSCALNDDEDITADLVNNCNQLLSERRCQECIDLLEGHGRRMTNQAYVMGLSSAYACRAGFDIPSLFANITNISSSPSGFIGSLSSLETSLMSSPRDESYVDLREAIEILLFSGSSTTLPSASDRIDEFGGEGGNEINVLLLWYHLAQIGKYGFYYGNANPTLGEKGTGSTLNGNPNNDGNECFSDYSATIARAAVALGQTGPCNNGSEGHPLLNPTDIGQELWVRRMCQGVVLMNNLVDVFDSVTLSNDFGNLQSLQGTLSGSVQTVCSGAGLGLVCSVKSQAECEENLGINPGDPDDLSGSNTLEVYFAIVWETLFT